MAHDIGESGDGALGSEHLNLCTNSQSLDSHYQPWLLSPLVSTIGFYQSSLCTISGPLATTQSRLLLITMIG